MGLGSYCRGWKPGGCYLLFGKHDNSLRMGVMVSVADKVDGEGANTAATDFPLRCECSRGRGASFHSWAWGCGDVGYIHMYKSLLRRTGKGGVS